MSFNDESCFLCGLALLTLSPSCMRFTDFGINHRLLAIWTMASAKAYSEIQLFGGSIVANLPSDFADVSDIRQVPDNQEVFLEQDGFTSVTFDVLEYVDKPDVDALEYHLKDIVEDDADKTKIISTASAHLSKLPTGTPALSLVAVSPPGDKQRGRPNEPDFVVIYLILVRLADKKTDILIIVNVPYITGQYDTSTVDVDAARFGELGDRAQQIREKLLQSFEVKDWSLFVIEEG